MKAYTHYLWFSTEKHREYINISRDVEDVVHKSGVKEGMVLISAMHITAAVYVNDAESGLIKDIEEWLQKLAPEGPDYHQNTRHWLGNAVSVDRATLIVRKTKSPRSNARADTPPVAI